MKQSHIKYWWKHKHDYIQTYRLRKKQQINHQNNYNKPWRIVSFLSTLTPESESAKVTRQKPTRCSLLSAKQLKYHDYTDKGRFLFGRRRFTVIYKNPKRGDRQITQIIKRTQSSERSLQLKQGLLNVLFNFAKKSPLQSPFQLFLNSLVRFWMLY